MLQGTFGLAKNTAQQFEARKMLRRDLVKTPGAGGCKLWVGTAWLPGRCHFHPSKPVLSLTAGPGPGPARQERTERSGN